MTHWGMRAPRRSPACSSPRRRGARWACTRLGADHGRVSLETETDTDGATDGAALRSDQLPVGSKEFSALVRQGEHAEGGDTEGDDTENVDTENVDTEQSSGTGKPAGTPGGGRP